MSSVDKSQWTPVEINVDGDFEGLIGIEEITDYNIESFRTSGGVSKLVKNTKKKKKINVKKDGVRIVKKPKNVFIEEEIKETNLDESDYFPWNNIFVPKEISRALLEKGFSEPTEIQRLAIPPALRGKKDILGAAETGSGKTLAFAIPIIYGILKNMEIEKENNVEDSIGGNKLWALVLTPTRELAIQVKNHIETALKYTSLKVAVIVGGLSAQKQERLLKRKPNIVVATPGRFWDLLSSNEPHLSDVENIKYLVIDETDRMIEANHFPELRALIERLNSDPNKMKQRQNFVFSATLSLVHELPSYIKKKKRGKKSKKELNPSQKLDGFIKLIGMTDPKIVDITQKTGTASGLTEAKIACSFEEKDFYLYYLLSVHPGRSLVFCNSISCVRRLASLLTALDMKPLPIHANMQQRQRLKNLDRFKVESRGLLLATDVAARGLDIPSVEHVIHYQVPRTSETYIHRSGRTARAQKKGLTVLLIEPNEVTLYSKICATLGKDKDVSDFQIDFKILKEAKERVKLAREIDRIGLELKKERAHVGWIEKSAEEMEIILDEDQKPKKSDDSHIARKRQILELNKKKLKKLLNTPFTSGQQVDLTKSFAHKSKINLFRKKKKKVNISKS